MDLEKEYEKGGRKKYKIERNGRAPENGKESLNSAHTNDMNEFIQLHFKVYVNTH